MIGDDLARDIADAQQVGIFAVWYDFAKRGLLDNICPDWIIHDFSEVYEALNLQAGRDVIAHQEPGGKL
jgi:FMN phosphatase YigB (HAD superfamily)